MYYCKIILTIIFVNVEYKRYICAMLLRLVVIISLINCALGCVVPTYFQLVVGGLTMFNFFKKGENSYEHNDYEGGRGRCGGSIKKFAIEMAGVTIILR